MTALAVLGALIALYGGFGITRDVVRRVHNHRAEQRTQAAHEARQAARAPAVIIAEVVDEEEARRRREWVTGCDAYIADWQDRWDALWAGEPLDDKMVVDYNAWRPVEEGPQVEHVDLVTLAEFEPTAVLARVEQENALPAVFSWHTQDLPTVPVGRATVATVQERIKSSSATDGRQTSDRRRQRREARHATLPTR